MNLLDSCKKRTENLIHEKYALLSRLDERTLELQKQHPDELELYIKSYTEDIELKSLNNRLDELNVEQQFLLKLIQRYKPRERSNNCYEN